MIFLPVDRFRYVLAVLNLIVIPPGLLFWFLIHPFTSVWRRLGLFKSYFIVVLLMIGPASLLYHFRERLVGSDLGTHWILVVVALLFYGASIPLERRYWRQLSFFTLAGVPELSRGGVRQDLLQDGIYGIIRHPRYASAGLGAIGSVLLANYTGTYLLGVLVIPLGYVLLELEERELTARFGEAYREYKRQVPRLIPRHWRR